MDYLKLIMAIFERSFLMLLHGERVKEIISLSFVDYANYLFDKEDIDRSDRYFRKALDYSPQNYYAYGGLATIHISRQLFKEALGFCDRGITLKPDILLYILQHVTYNALDDTDSAEKVLQKILVFFNNEKAAAYDRLAYTYYKFGMYGKAEYYCKEAIKFEPKEAGPHYNLGKIYQAKGQHQLAKEEFQKVLVLTGNKKYRKYAKMEIGKMDF